jgi:endonuclease G
LYIETLRATYNLTITPAATPPHGAPAGSVIAPPPAPGDFPAAPPFEAQIEDPVRLEQVLNSEDNFLDLHVLLGAIYSARAVARIEVPEGSAKGTGFLIAPDLLLTNQHVLKDTSFVEETVVRFGYLKDLLTVPLEGQIFKLVPGFYYASPQDELDYALVKVDGEPLKDIRFTGKLGEKTTLELIRENKHRGYLQVAGRNIQNLDRVNIIQHPNGNPLKVVLTQNYVTASMSATRVHYLADTDDGSSGSPVFNERWEVVALHHGSKETQLTKPGGGKRVSYENEGIPMRAILEDFKGKNLLKFLPEYR